ncbi:DUF4283 domain-containing protein [Salix suchowensis]|nr:DUF4283 domain-containing protein [Salix suchowensis]
MHSTDQWARCMIGFFTGYKPPFRAVNLIATKAWKQYGLEQVMTMATGFYIFRFTGEEAVQEVIEKGPWMFGGKNIILQKWTPSFHFNRNKIPTISVWVRLKGLPLPLWTKQGLSMAASMVGKPLSCDEQTMGCRRLEFARLCVELDAALPFVHHFEVESPLTEEPQRVDVEYEWKPPRCESCRSFGHNCERMEKQETAAHHDEGLPSEPPSNHPHTLAVQLCKGGEPNPNQVVKNHIGPSRLDKGKQVQSSNTGTHMEGRPKESRVEVHPNPPQTSSNHNPSIADREGQLRTTNRIVPQLSQSESTSNTALSTMHRQENQSKGNSHPTGHKEGLQGNQQSSITRHQAEENEVTSEENAIQIDDVSPLVQPFETVKKKKGKKKEEARASEGGSGSRSSASKLEVCLQYLSSPYLSNSCWLEL